MLRAHQVAAVSLFDLLNVGYATTARPFPVFNVHDIFRRASPGTKVHVLPRRATHTMRMSLVSSAPVTVRRTSWAARVLTKITAEQTEARYALITGHSEPGWESELNRHPDESKGLLHAGGMLRGLHH